MEVLVILGCDESDVRANPEDASLEGKAVVRQEGRRGSASQVGDRGRFHWEEPRPVLKRLYRPAFEAAGRASTACALTQAERSRERQSDYGRENERRCSHRHSKLHLH